MSSAGAWLDSVPCENTSWPSPEASVLTKRTPMLPSQSPCLNDSCAYPPVVVWFCGLMPRPSFAGNLVEKSPSHGTQVQQPLFTPGAVDTSTTVLAQFW